MAVTAKVVLQSAEQTPNGTQLTFNADYADGRNKEWAKYTPTLSLQMVVKDEVADEHFDVHSAYTLTFEPNED